MTLQTSNENAVRIECFSPEKRTNLHQSQLKHIPVKIVDARKNLNRRFSSRDEYTTQKKAKVTPTKLDFAFNSTFSNRFHTVDDALKGDYMKRWT